jgi:hypothetical protein
MAWQGSCWDIDDNSVATTAAGYSEILSAGTVMNVYKNGDSASTWTNVNTKGANVQIEYGI